MNRPFDHALFLGQIGENWVCRKAREAGFLIERNSAEPVVNGLGPRAYSADYASIPRPDFVFSKRGANITAEIKTKSDRTVGQITGAEETGIDYRRWIDYRDYQRATGNRVLLLNVEYIGRRARGRLADWLIQMPEARKEFEEIGATTYYYPATAVLGQWIECLTPSLDRPTPCNGKEMIYFAISQFATDWLALMDKAITANGILLL